MHDNYVRKAKVLRVVNGNTLDLEFNLGLGVKVNRRVDLARISPKDQFSDMGDKAAVFMHERLVSQVPEVNVAFGRHPDNPDRILAEVYDDLDQNITDLLLTNLLADEDARLTLNVLG